jgi:hypothetical protein
MHNFHTNYQQRPNIFESFSPYEFSSKVNKINNTHCNRFHQNYLQYNIHSLNEYKIPKILVIKNYTIPSQINYLENHAMYFIFFMVDIVQHKKKIAQQLGV